MYPSCWLPSMVALVACDYGSQAAEIVLADKLALLAFCPAYIS